MLKALHIDAGECTNCLQCEMACSYENEGVFNPAKSYIKVFTFHAEGRFVPYTCTQCAEAWCMAACPVDAITEQDGIATVLEACLGCGVCARFCPSGALRMEARSERPWVPKDFVEKTLFASIDAAKTGNYLFSDQTSRTHAVLRRTLNRLLRVSAVRRALQTESAKRRLIRVLDWAMPEDGR